MGSKIENSVKTKSASGSRLSNICVKISRKKRFGGGGRRYSVKERQDMNLSYLQSLPSNSLVVLQDNDSTWRSVFVQLLERSLSPAHVQGLPISTQNIIFNMTHVSPKGVVQVLSNITVKNSRFCKPKLDFF